MPICSKAERLKAANQWVKNFYFVFMNAQAIWPHENREISII